MFPERKLAEHSSLAVHKLEARNLGKKQEGRGALLWPEGQGEQWRRWMVDLHEKGRTAPTF